MSISINEKEHIWCEKFRPQTMHDLIIPKHLEKTFNSIIENKKIPNLLLASRIPGIGKTGASKVIASELNCDVLFVNASLDANLDLLRDKLDKFASSLSLEEGGKVIILDEIDGASRKNSGVFDSLRGFIEKYSSNCSFIFTCNHAEVIPDAIKSRCQVIDYHIRDLPDFSKKTWERVQEILKVENVEYDKKVVLEIIKKFSPDVRTILQNLQMYKSELTDETLKYRVTGVNIEKLVKYMKEKDFKGILDFVNNDLEVTAGIFRQLFNALEDFVDESSLPIAIQILGEYNKTFNVSVDPTISTTAMLVEFTENCGLK
jgi:replication factor C small subunit